MTTYPDGLKVKLVARNIAFWPFGAQLAVEEMRMTFPAAFQLVSLVEKAVLSLKVMITVVLAVLQMTDVMKLETSRLTDKCCKPSVNWAMVEPDEFDGVA